MSERMNPRESAGCSLVATRLLDESATIQGKYQARCYRVEEPYREQADLLLLDIVQMRAQEAAQDKIDEAVATFSGLPRREVWEDEIVNVVTTVGKNLTLDTVLAGSAYTASAVMGLKGAGTAVAGDTMASHGAWVEVGLANAPAYSGNRPVPAFSAASAGVKQTSTAAAFTFTSGGTVAGCFIVLAGSATKDTTSGTLLSAGDFSGGNKVVASTDVLNVTYSLAL